MRLPAVILGAVLAAGAVSAAPAKLTGNKAVLQKIYDAYNTNEAGALEGFIAADAVTHDLPVNIRPGVAGLQDLSVLLSRAFPDFKIHVQDMIAEGDRVAARILFTGTHQGEFLGIPATGKSVAYTGIQYVTFRDGKAKELWSFMDHERLKAQLVGPAGVSKK